MKTDRTAAPLDWQLVTAAAGYIWPEGPHARVVRIRSAGDLYLVKNHGDSAAGVLFEAGLLAGDQITVQHVGIGTLTTCDCTTLL